MAEPTAVEVKLTPRGKMYGCLFALFIPMGLIIGMMSANEYSKLYKSPIPIAVGILLSCTPFILTFARRFAVARVDERGLTLKSGKLFPWTELKGINQVQVMKNGRKVRVDYVLGFRGGGVRIRSNEYDDTRPLWAFLEKIEKTAPR